MAVRQRFCALAKFICSVRSNTGLQLNPLQWTACTCAIQDRGALGNGIHQSSFAGSWAARFSTV